MKKVDIFLIIIAILIGAKLMFSFFSLNLFVKILVGIFVFCLFLYKQIKPHKNVMYPKNLKWFSYIELLFDWLFKVFKFKPIKLGDTLSIDSTFLIVLSVLITLLII